MKPNFYVPFLVLSLFFSQKLFAVEKFWTGATDSNWNTPSNWNPSGVPNSNDVVYIQSTTVKPVIQNGTTAYANLLNLSSSTLTVNNGGILNVSGTLYTTGMGMGPNAILQNNGTINLQEKIITAGLNCSIINNGQLSVNSTDNFVVIGYPGYSLMITNNASGVLALASGKLFQVASGSTCTVTNSGTISAGYLTAAPGSTFQLTNNACGKVITEAIYQNNGGSTTNAGFFQVGSNLEHTGGIFTNNGVLKYGSQTGNGIVSIANSSIIVNDTPTPIFTYGGTYNGTINGIYTNSGATTSAGTFTAPNTFAPSAGLPNGSQTLYAKITPSGGACSYVVPFTYTAVAPPAITNFTTVDNTVCADSPIGFTATVGNVSPPYAYTLTNGSSTTTGNSSTTSFSQNLTASGSGVQTFTLTVNDGGASSSATTNVTVNTLPTANSYPAGVALTCSAPTYSLTATGTGTVLWSTGATTPVISATAAGIYSFTLTDANGCQASDFSTVTSNQNTPGALLSASGTLNCAVSSVTLTVETGTGLSFAFSSGASQIGGSSGRRATVTTPGIYSVTATGGNSCTSTSSVTVLSDVASPTASVNSVVNQLDCNTTVITLTASGGGTYLWNNGQTTATRNVNTAGTYSVTVTGANGCTAVASRTITSNTTPPTANILAPASTTLTCTTPSLSLTATGGGTYRWDNNTTAAVRTVNASGTYSVTVTGANSCTAVATQDINSNTTPPTASISSVIDQLDCNATVITLTASGGGTYLWSNGQTTATRNVNTAGTYSVTVTGANGCTATASKTITSNTTPPTATILTPASTILTCATPSLSLTATGGGTYRWDNNSINAIRTVSSSGTYSVTVTSTNSCSATASVAVSQSTTLPTASLVSSGTLTCAVTSVTLTASGGTAYSFSGPGIVSQSGNTAVVNVAGTYSVTVTNGTTGCTSVTNVVISQSTTLPTPGLLSSGTLTCAQTSVTLTASGGSSYGFAGPGIVSQSGNTAVVNAAGTYSVTVTNGATGCTSVTNVVVSQSTTLPTPGLVSSGTLTCTQTSVTLTASGGSSYAFAGPGIVSQSGNTAVVNVAGTYSVTVTNGATGCTSVTNVVISQSTTLPTASLLSSGTLTCAQTSITLTASGGSSYAFAGPGVVSQSANMAVVNVAGTYSVTVTNGATGCSSVTSVVVNQNATLPVAGLVSSGTLTCSVTSATLTASGGSSYAFAGPGIVSQSGNTAVVNAAGTYSVTVTNGATGCTSVTSVGVSQSTTLPTASLLSSGTLTCAQTSVTLTASGGSSYAFAGPGVVSQSANTAVVNAAGTYSVTVTNGATGCTSVTSVGVSQSTTLPTASLLSSGTLTCAVTSVTLTASGGTTYSFSGPGVVSQSGNTAVVNAAGTYSVTVTNGATGCTSVTSVAVSQSTTLPTASLLSSGTLTCAVTSVTLTASGGSSYAFAGPGVVSQSGNMAVVNAAGTYSVTVTNGATGCTSVTSVVVEQNNIVPSVSISPSSATLTCANPSLTLTASGSAASLRWANNSTATTLSVSTSGVYSVTATGANGCTAVSNSVEISDDKRSPSLMLISSSPTACSPATITLTAQATGAIDYAFSTGATKIGTSNQAIVTQTGVYSVTVSNASGCTASASVSVTVNAPPTAPTLTGASHTVTQSNTPLSLGQFVNSVGSNSLSFSSVNGLLMPPNADISMAGTLSFSVTQTDANGCVSVPTPFTITVQQNTATTPDNQTVCRSSQVILTTTTTGARYEWYKNGQSIPFKLTEIASIQRGTSTASLTLVSVQTTATYYVKVFAANSTSTPGSFTWVGPMRVTVDFSCVTPGARQAAPTVTEVPLSIKIVPNPITDNYLRAIIGGVAGQPLSVQLVDERGQLIREQSWSTAQADHQIEWFLSSQPAGLYWLQVSTPGQAKTVKIILL